MASYSRIFGCRREAGVPRLSGRESTLSVEAVEIETKEPVGNGAQS